MLLMYIHIHIKVWPANAFQMQGDTYGCASEVPASIRSSICTAAMKAMAKVHCCYWVAGGQKKQDGLSRDFWSKQVS